VRAAADAADLIVSPCVAAPLTGAWLGRLWRSIAAAL
jgi:hypothetical protein